MDYLVPNSWNLAEYIRAIPPVKNLPISHVSYDIHYYKRFGAIEVGREGDGRALNG